MITKGRSSSRIGAEAIAVEIAGLRAVEAAFSAELGEAFERAVRLISSRARNVVVTGVGKSGHVGRKVAATLASTGTPAVFVHAAEASHGDLGMIHPDDVVLALSWSGETPELSDIIAYTRRFDIRLISITGNPKGALAMASDIALVLPSSVEACPNGLAPTTSTVMQVAMGDALAVALLSARGFTASDFRLFHPGGKLGAQLRQVSEVMRTIDNLPHVPEEATVGDMLVRMSHFGLGYSLVIGPCNELLGIVTDGDLRRNMSSDLLSRPVGAIMTRRPKIFDPSMLAARALSFLNEHRITAAPVARDGFAVGGVHMIDFVKSGVV